MIGTPRSPDSSLDQARQNADDNLSGLAVDSDDLIVDEEDIEARKLPLNTTGVVVTKIDPESPVKDLKLNNIIVEAQRKKIKTIGELENLVKIALRSNDKTMLIAIYNNQNQRRYIGVKLD